MESQKKSSDEIIDQKKLSTTEVITEFKDMEKIQDPEPDIPSLNMTQSEKEDGYTPSTQTQNNIKTNGGSAFNVYMLFCTLVVGLGGLNWGYENALVGPISAMKAFVRDMQGINKDTGLYVLSASHQSIIFSVPLTGTVVGALLTTPVQNKFGRKYALIGSYTTSMGAVFLQLFAPNFVAFVIGRWWNAVSYGAALAIAPNFMADLVPAKMRGRFVSGANIATIASSVLATVACYIAESTHGDDKLSYKIPLAVQATLPFLMTIPTFFVCESPSWLLSKGRLDDARKTLRSIRGFSDEEVDKELEILQAIEAEALQREKPRYWDIYKKQNIRRTLVGGSIFSLNQLSGIILSTTFAAVFLTQLGAGNPFLFSVIGNLCLLAGTIGAPFVLDNFGRRPTALIGFTILLGIDITAGILAFFAKTNRNAALVIAVLSFLFNIVWTLSFYSISLLMPAEIPSEKMRNATMTHAIGCGQMTAILTTLVVPLITAQDAANLGAKAYLIFAGLMAIILILAFLLLPETKGRTSLEIDELYGRKIPAWRWKGFETSANRLAAQALQ